MTQQTYTTEEIVRKFIGPTDPLGCSRGDEERLANTAKIAALAESLIEELVDLTKYKDDHRASMKAIGKRAQASIDEVREIVGVGE